MIRSDKSKIGFDVTPFEAVVVVENIGIIDGAPPTGSQGPDMLLNISIVQL